MNKKVLEQIHTFLFLFFYIFSIFGLTHIHSSQYKPIFTYITGTKTRGMNTTDEASLVSL
jgi:hypothetical protein